MSEPEPTAPESAEASTGESPRTRRISNTRPKKSAKPQRPKNVAGEQPAPPSYPVFDLSESPEEQPKSVAGSGDWPEPEPPSPGDTPPQEGSKRKRRRKKGKGGGQQNAALVMTSDAAPVSEAETAAVQPSQPRPSQQHRAKVDPEKVAKLALKIYLAEVSEEGVALIGDNDAKELSRRCFRLAEIFIEEESRRR
jgi:hypothetical protein